MRFLISVLKNHSFSVLVLLILFSACQQNESHDHAAHDNTPATTPAAPQAASTIEMANELKRIATNPDNKDMWYLNSQKATRIESQLEQLRAQPGPFVSASFMAAAQWLNAGDYDRSINLMNQLFEYMNTNNIQLKPAEVLQLKEVLAIAFMRKGEIENCLNNHNAYSCLLPIEGPGQHKNKAGSQAALGIYKNILTENPNDAQAKWLYNIAHMTLGTYPDGVEPAYRIAPNIFESEATLPRFTDIAMDLGVAVNDISGSVVLEDFNGDHYLDILASSYGLEDQLRYFENDGQGGFTDKTAAAGLTGLWSGLNMVQADYNNDGLMDVLVLRGAWLSKEGKHPNSLLKNEGNGRFTDVTKSAGLYALFPTQTASWADYNNDGWVDLFVGNESSPSVNAPCQLYHNNGDGTFTEKAKELGLDISAYVKGCSWGDANQDGWPDLYISNITGPNLLMINGGAGGRFENRAAAAGVQEPNNSFPCWFFDYDQDGLEDIFVSGFDVKQFETAAGEVAKDYMGLPTQAEKPRLYRNKGDGTFTEVSQQASVDKVLYTMGCNVGDLNNDGFPDFYAATGTPDFRALIPNRMFLNDSGRSFKDVTKAGGFGHLQKGHGIAFGDLDADGDQDVYAVLGGSYQGDNFMNALFQNPGTNNQWVTLKLEGSSANKAAIGALVKTTTIQKDGREQIFYQVVRSGGSFGANTLNIEQGLGACQQIKEVTVLWPGAGSPELISGVQPGGYYKVVQGSGAARRIELKSIVFKKGGHAGHVH